MTEAVFTQTVSINKTHTATVFSLAGHSFPRAMISFAFGLSSFNVHMTAAESVQLAAALVDVAHWLQSEASRKEVQNKQAEQDRIPAGASPVEARFLMEAA